MSEETGSVKSCGEQRPADGEYQIDLEEDAEDGDSDYIVLDEPETPPPPVPPRSSSVLGEFKRIDFVLAYRATRTNPNNFETNQDLASIRAVYENNLKQEGLVLQTVQSTVENEYSYVHIYAPYDTLARYAELMNLRMPMRGIRSSVLNPLFEKTEYDTNNGKSNEANSSSWLFKKFTTKSTGMHKLGKNTQYTTNFSRDKEYLFAIPPDRDQFFTPSQRSEIIDFILRRTSFSTSADDAFNIGIHKLLADTAYLAAYPLHDEGVECHKKDCPTKRCYLKHNWASLKCMIDPQPLDALVDYFGIKISMYYAWIGFYTNHLLWAALGGIVTVICGLATVLNSSAVREVCSHDDNVLMCPTCSKCNYTRIADSCFEVKTSHLFGNVATVVFAMLMSLWATLFLEYWKRYSARIAFSWDLSDYSTIDEVPRPEFLNSQRKKRKHLHPVTGQEEPFIPLSNRLPYLLISSSSVLLFIAVTLGIMVAITTYRVSVQISLYAIIDETSLPSTYVDNFVVITAAIINLLLIMFLSWIYKSVAYTLTDLEMPRTQAEFDSSLTLKMFLFEFVNYYSSFLYIAFIKGRFRAQPPEGGLQLPGSGLRSLLTESCSQGGCYNDLAVQMIIIFVGKAMITNCIEYLLPRLKSLYNRYQYLGSSSSSQPKKLEQWEEDVMLESWDHMSLFYEYLELVIQFGFVTLFVSAFPLAPFFALINNVLELRFDASKHLFNYKRPVAHRVKDIGIWYAILDALGKLSVFTNSMIIAFTTDIIPQMVYLFQHGNLEKYYDTTLSEYEISKEDPQPFNNTLGYCLYTAYRQPPWVKSETKYKYTEQHWMMLIYRIGFLVFFQNIVAAMNSLLKMIIPDVPKTVTIAKRKHMFYTNELIIRRELIKKRADGCAGPQLGPQSAAKP